MSWTTPGYEGLELSTQLLIGEALRRGHEVDVLDSSANFIRLRGRGKTEYVRQATRTAVDSYIAPLIMENKLVTKRVLEEAGIRVPRGCSYASVAQARADFDRWRAKGVVIKPNTTNFGIGVSMLAAPVSPRDFIDALDTAFQADSVVLAEELLSGREYRFLVIGDAVRAILHRVPAHVVGDGVHTVAELVRAKNADPRRGKGYGSPLEKLATGPEELAFLATQGQTLDSVPARGAVAYLRRNSNISTGGDSIDMTDEMHVGYRELAVAAAAAVGAQVCGVDMLVDDVSAEPDAGNYGVIELNFNPALHIHDYPSQGTNRHVERFVLDLLEL